MRKEVEDLDTKLETEAMKFSAEKAIKKTIKELKTQIKKKAATEETFVAAKSAGKDFHEIRKQAEISHKQVQEFAEQSQEKHEAMQEVLKKIKEERKARDPISKEYLEKKNTWNVQKKICDDLAKEVKELKEDLGMQSQKDRKEQVKEKAKEVEEKIKKGGKLTTEDILAMQAVR